MADIDDMYADELEYLLDQEKELSTGPSTAASGIFDDEPLRYDDDEGSDEPSPKKLRICEPSPLKETTADKTNRRRSLFVSRENVETSDWPALDDLEDGSPRKSISDLTREKTLEVPYIESTEPGAAEPSTSLIEALSTQSNQMSNAGRVNKKTAGFTKLKPTSKFDSLRVFSGSIEDPADSGRGSKVDLSLPKRVYESVGKGSLSAEQLKAQKLKEMEDERMIQKIIERRHTIERNLFMESIDSCSRLGSQDGRQSCVQRSRPAHRSWQTVTCPATGKRYYLDVLAVEKHEVAAPSMMSFSSNDLLSAPFDELMTQVEVMEREKLLLAVDEATRTHTPSRHDEPEQNENQDADRGRGAVDLNNNTALWVDKYRPHGYTDLISDEGTNRTLLTWLKLWDELVFSRVNRKRRQVEQPDEDEEGSSTSDQPPADHGKRFDKNAQTKTKWIPKPKTILADEMPMELDKHKRPFYKIALLSGPPGLGKTTLAHIIARHAGYRPMEMNASDDRSLEKFRKLIDDATQMRKTLDADNRPVCVVVDEIDGAPVACINYLISLTKDKKDGEKKGHVVLKRPIVCICNDMYAPALRELRSTALMISFHQTEQERLTRRLSEICLKEGYDVDRMVLKMLCDKTNNDVRSCINTLQMVRKRNLTIDEIKGLSVGQKDMQKGLFELWDEIFFRPSMTRGMPLKRSNTGPRHGVADRDTTDGSFSARFKKILHGTYACQQEEKLREGLFENYLSIPFKDPKFNAVTLSSDWLLLEDHMMGYIRQRQSFELMAYLPFYPVVFHLLFAVPVKQRLPYPRTANEVRQKKAVCESIVSQLYRESSPYTRSFFTEETLVLDILPLLMHLMTPALRPVSTQLFNRQEKQELSRVVNLMLNYNLTYVQRKSDEGQLVYKLEPEIDVVTSFQPAKDSRPVTFATKQLIAREVELEKIHRADRGDGGGREAHANTNKQPGRAGDRLGSSASRPAKNSSSAREKTGNEGGFKVSLKDRIAQAGKMGIPAIEKTAKDFFGRPIASSDASQRRREDIDCEGELTSILFKFQEGHNTAVKKTVRIKDFL